jgi:magnesium chelatase family protein
MTYAITYSRAAVGIQAPLITVEADTTSGLPQIIIVGLPETAVKESKDRVKTAIINAGYSLPNKRLTVNLSPADLPKSGGRYDLAIALCILVGAGNLPEGCLKEFEFLGELALNGETRFVSGILPASIQICSTKRSLVVPAVNGPEAALVETSLQVFAASSLQEVIAHLLEREPLALVKGKTKGIRPIYTLKLSDVRGQKLAKRALTIAAAGAHNLLFIGPPGSGKTMLASRLGSLLPTMSIEESLSSASVQSVSKYQFDTTSFGVRPFRTPHHTASAVALVGGGNPPRPGEISLAHNGVLFLDELPEYPRHVLEVLREPIESGEIIISRAHHQVRFPANF